MKSSLLYILLFLVPVPVMAQVAYIPAKKYSQIVKVDRIPLDAPTITMLSQALSTIAQRDQILSPEQLRCNAQLIGLALRLDSRNEHAQQLDKALKKGKLKEFTSEGDLAAAYRRVGNVLCYLETKAAGFEANLLSDMMKDALVVAKKDLEVVSDHVVKNDRWSGIVPLMASYKSLANEAVIVSKKEKKRAMRLKNRGVIKNERIGSEFEAVQDNEDIKESKLPQYPDAYAMLSSELKLLTMSRLFREENFSDIDFYRFYEHRAEIVSVQLAIRSSEEAEVSFLNKAELEINTLSGDIRRASRTALEQLWSGDLPKANVEITLSHGYSELSESTVAAPMVLMTHAALLGKELRDDVMVAFGLTTSGELIRPDTMWSNLKCLRASESKSRVLISHSSIGDFEQLNALGELGLLLRNEVIAVSNTREAFELACASDDEQVLVSSLYKEIQKVAPSGSNLRTFLANPFVRERLEQILEHQPNHVSAKILKEAGEDAAAVTIENRYFAMEMFDVLRNYSQLIRVENHYEISSTLAYEVNEALAEELEEIELFLDDLQKVVVEEVRALNAELRSLARSLKEKGDSFHDRQAISSLESMKTRYLLLETRLKGLAG